MDIKQKIIKKSFKTVKVKLLNSTTKLKKGISATCHIFKDDFITFYGIINPDINNLVDNKMNVFVNKQLYEGDPSEKNKLSMGQFSNDNAFNITSINMIKEGNIKDAYRLYIDNVEEKNNAILINNKKPFLIAKRDIHPNEEIYVQYGLSYWITIYKKYTSNIPFFYSRINTYALQLVQLQNDFIIFYDKKVDYSKDYIVDTYFDKETNIKTPILLYKNEKMSEGIALIILCYLYKLHALYVTLNNLPHWIYKSPYKALLFLNLIMSNMPNQIDNLIFKSMLNKQYDKAYQLYCNLSNSDSCKEFVNKDDFIFYYKHIKDLKFVLHKTFGK